MNVINSFKEKIGSFVGSANKKNISIMNKYSNISIDDLNNRKSILEEELKDLKTKMVEIDKISLGKGDLHDAIMRPTEINERINELNSMMYDSYTGEKVDDKKYKEMNEEIVKLNQELKDAEKNANGIEKDMLKTESEFLKKSKELKELNKAIHEIEKNKTSNMTK